MTTALIRPPKYEIHVAVFLTLPKAHFPNFHLAMAFDHNTQDALAETGRDDEEIEASDSDIDLDK